ncbi:DNA-binding transcriptional regulator, MarR family [Lysobacter sp. yr284]|uniref:MarR family winged helix-turn-helix transcriptional regulator n=1 Tax=Lysobacter sp. yr284 TaxID=1761791 RepID=UPI000898E208|nr:MarR family transcriptional regulator [Lysobacter sp. yr284]SDZ20621.1 DNA-binding transcriptional regulator, MarR family [Lysobacter sp. yr284]
MDYPRSLGGAAIGARLRRLAERIDGDVARIYAEAGLEFEQRWFGVLNQLALNGPATVGDLAATLGITHASISQTRSSLEKAGLVQSQTDPGDARRRPMQLTRKGRQLVERLTPLWQMLEQVGLQIVAEVDGLIESLDRLDDVLSRQSLFERVFESAPELTTLGLGRGRKAR